MDNIEIYLEKYFSNINYMEEIAKIVDICNKTNQTNLTVYEVDINTVIRFKYTITKFNLDPNGGYTNFLDWVFLFFLEVTGIEKDVLVQMLGIEEIVPNMFANLCKNYSYNVECNQMIYENVNSFITALSMKLREVPSRYIDQLKGILELIDDQMLRIQFNFDEYLQNNVMNGNISDSNDMVAALAMNNYASEKVEYTKVEYPKEEYTNASNNVSYESIKPSSASVNQSTVEVTGTELVGYREKIKSLIDNGVKQIIFTGAPGTGKTYLAKEIAKEYAIAEGVNSMDGSNYHLVQFHTSFDYTDFVEGLRPIESRDKVVEFRKIDGIFKEFCRKVQEENIKEIYMGNGFLANRDAFQTLYLKYIRRIIKSAYQGAEYLNLNEKKANYDLRMRLKDITTDDSLRIIENSTWGQIADGNIDKFIYDHIDEKVYIYNAEKLRELLASDATTSRLISRLFEISDKDSDCKWREIEHKRKYFFIIDEINRADLSKVLGELMYCFEKDKRGPLNAVQTQYRNLTSYSTERRRELAKFEDVFVDGFFIPENVVIVGTMNDIDRSVESMDFALRRRFIFEEFYVDYDNLMIAFTSNSFKFSQKLSNELACSTCLLNKYIHMYGEQYGLNSHYDISQGQFSDVDRRMVDKGSSNVKSYVWQYRVGSLIREYLRGENESEIKNFSNNAKAMFDINITFSKESNDSLYKEISKFWKNLNTQNIKRDELEEFFEQMRINGCMDKTDLWNKLV